MAAKVRVLSTFSVVHEMGPLVIKDMLGNVVKEMAPAQTVTLNYTEGETLKFSTKVNAKAFCKAHAGKVEML